MPISKLKPITVPGERIYELLRTDEFSDALAFIERSVEHWHKRTHERYIVIDGNGFVSLDDWKLPVDPGCIIDIKPKTDHYAAGKNGPLCVYVICVPPWTPEDHHLTDESGNKPASQ